MYVVFDRKCKVKDDNGVGAVDVFVYLERRERKYINVGQCRKNEFEGYSQQKRIQAIVRRCEKVIAALPVLNLEVNVDNFNAYYYDEDEKEAMNQGPKNLYKGTDKNTNFIEYMQQQVDEEDISKGTRAHKQCTIEALKRFGKIKTFADLTSANIAAYTGLAYIDVMDFNFKKHAVKDGKFWYIDGSRIKTHSDFYTPILPAAMDILKKYNYKLPRLCNQKANDYLHLIQEKIGCRKNLTFHIGRHSFATLILSHNIPMENLQRMLGHRDIKQTQIYGKILNSTIKRNTEGMADELL